MKSTEVMKKRMISEFLPLLSEARFIGYVPEEKIYPALFKALNNHEQFTALKELMRTARALLAAQFDELAQNGELESLRASNQKRFVQLWRAKFLKDPLTGEELLAA